MYFFYRRLSSPYDLFATMSHVLDTFTNTTQLPLEKSRNGTIFHRKYGQSLFSEIPLTRDCASAGVLDDFCACVVPTKVATSDTTLIRAAEAAVEYINTFLPTQCAPFRLSRVISGAIKAQNFTNFNVNKAILNSNVAETVLLHPSYIVAFTTNPGEFLFESNVKYDSSGKQSQGSFQVGTEILRMNKISTDVSCIHSAYLERFCYCKNLL